MPAWLLPAIANSMRQIAPSVVATLIAAVLIAGYNRAFSGHLVQPRMAALHSATPAEPPAPAVAAKLTNETVTIHEETDEPERIAEKDRGGESGKDQTAVKAAEAPPAAQPLPQHIAPRSVARAEPRAEIRRERVFEPRVIESRLMAMPGAPAPQAAPVQAVPVIVQRPVVQAAPAPGMVVAAAPPPGMAPAYPPPPVVAAPIAEAPVAAAKPAVTVPDRQRPPQGAQVQAGDAPPPPSGFGSFVNALRPSSIFARMREFGDKIEATGNDILPSLRQ